MAFEDKTTEELHARFVVAGSELTVLENERQALLEEMENRKKEAAAAVRLSTLTDDQKDSLRVVLNADLRTDVQAEMGAQPLKVIS